MAISIGKPQSEKAEDAIVFRSSLADKHAQLEAKLAHATSSLNKTFITKLGQFERQAAQVEDFAQAIVYRNRRLALVESMERHDPHRANQRAANAITLSLSEASLTGSVSLQRNVLKGWKTSATAATWNLRGLTPGNYEIVMTYSCTKAVKDKSSSGNKTIHLRAGGQFTFGETSRLLNGERQSLVHQVQPTTDWDTYRDVSLGTLTFSNAAVSLRLNVIEAKPLGLMQLKGVQLIPIAERVKRRPIPQSADLQRSFQNAVKRRKEAIRAAYIEDLKSLQQRAKASGNHRLAQEIDRALEATATP